MPNESVDVVGLGVSTIDELLVVDHHPLPNHKQKILSRTRQCGGLTGSALVAASRQGVRCGYMITLGNGELSSYLRSHLQAEGVQIYENNDTPEAEPYLSIIITDKGEGERSILWDNSQARPPVIGEREKEIILSARCLFVDHVWASAIYPIVYEARAAGVDVVGDFERTVGSSKDLLSVTNHVILPLGYCRELFGASIDSVEAVTMLASSKGRSFACVTDGLNGSWFALGDTPDKVHYQPAFTMRNIVDTTGCGDVFHGVYVSSLVHGYPPAERVRRSAAAAALKTQKAGAQAGAPTNAELEMFLLSRAK